LEAICDEVIFQKSKKHDKTIFEAPSAIRVNVATHAGSQKLSSDTLTRGSSDVLANNSG
jgi:hypothetical protein